MIELLQPSVIKSVVLRSRRSDPVLQYPMLAALRKYHLHLQPVLLYLEASLFKNRTPYSRRSIRAIDILGGGIEIVKALAYHVLYSTYMNFEE